MNSQWHFVIAAYAVTAAGTLGVFFHSWSHMRRAERAVDELSAPSEP
jgi:hypothetical protein